MMLPTMDTNPDHEMFDEIEDAPPDRPEPAAPPPPRVWPFDVNKLLRLTEQSRRAHLARTDISARVREARELLTRTRSGIIQDEASHGRAHADTYRRLQHHEAELQRLLAEQRDLEATTTSAVATAQMCRVWAESRGWTEDGSSTPGAPRPRIAGGETETPMISTGGPTNG